MCESFVRVCVVGRKMASIYEIQHVWMRCFQFFIL